MLFVVEGTDCAGKTTFCHSLKDQLERDDPGCHVNILHKGPPTQHPLDEYVKPLLNYRPGIRHHIICDRWHLGEVVYPRILQRPSKMTGGVFRYIEAFLKSKGGLLVVATASTAIIAKRYQQRGDAHRSLDEVLLAKREFDRIVSGYTTFGPSSIAPAMPNVATSMARRLEIDARRVARLTTYVGTPYPSWLYIGNKRSCRGGAVCTHKTKHSGIFPAFGPYPNTSGAYLMDTLPSMEFGLVNIADSDSRHEIAELISDNPSASIVALGRAAQLELLKIGVKHTAVPHPEFARRFHHHANDEYFKMLTIFDGKEHSWRS